MRVCLYAPPCLYPRTQVERLRKLAKRWREGDAEAFRNLNKEVAHLSPDEYYHVRRLRLLAPPFCTDGRVLD